MGLDVTRAAPGCAIPACLCCREAEEHGGQRQFAPTPSQNQGGEKTEHLNHTRWPRLVSSPFVALQLRPQQNRGWKDSMPKDAVGANASHRDRPSRARNQNSTTQDKTTLRG